MTCCLNPASLCLQKRGYRARESHRQQVHLAPHTSHLTPHTSHLTPHTSHLTQHTSHTTPHTPHFTQHTSHLTPHTSHTPHTPHTSHLTDSADTLDVNLPFMGRNGAFASFMTISLLHTSDSYTSSTISSRFIFPPRQLSTLLLSAAATSSSKLHPTHVTFLNMSNRLRPLL